MQSRATTVTQYLSELPPDRRAAADAVIQVIRANADPLLEEGMQYGMIGWYVPHRVFPAGYHADPRQPLPFACLASQKNHLSLYLMSVYADGTSDEQWFRMQWARTGKALDMGKSCIRFKRAEDLALDVIAEAFQRVGVERHLEVYAQVDPRNRPKGAPKAKQVAKKTAKKTAKKVAKVPARNLVKKSASKSAKPAPKK